jgi:nucleotide-binding universal stress UspA family protein
MFQRILVPLDGSARAEEALPVAARIARASGGSVHLLQVVSPPIDYGGGLAAAPLLSEQVIESEMSEATHYLKTVAAWPGLSGIQISTEVACGLPAQYILAVARSGEVDLIVLCSHGRTGFTRWVLGSVAHTLAHESTVHTLVLRESEPAALLTRSDAARPLCALVPLDGSALSETALIPAARLVAALAAPAQGALRLVQVVKLVQATADEGFVREINVEALQRARTYLATAAERLQMTAKELGLAVTWSVAQEKDVASALVNLAEHGEKGCDLIVISTHGRGGLERLVMGSVAERLLTATKLPVLIVRPPK